MTTESSLSPPEPENESYFERRLKQIAVFIESPNAHEVLASGELNPIRVVALRAIMATPGLPDFLHRHAMAPEYRRAGFNILGIGFGAVTVGDGPESVLKYYRHTAGENEASQQATIQTWTAKQDLVLEHLGQYAVPQTFTIEQNPLNLSESIIAARQSRIKSTGAINVFRSNEIPACAVPFIEDSQHMHHNSGRTAVPDLVGRNNALIEAGTGAIKLIDPIALTSYDPGDEAAYLRAVDFLDNFPT
ncbi:MAG: hypothetical protein ACOH18_02050 [Candidatus Saccharimonadaceae bacterium]